MMKPVGRPTTGHPKMDGRFRHMPEATGTCLCEEII